MATTTATAVPPPTPTIAATATANTTAVTTITATATAQTARITSDPQRSVLDYEAAWRVIHTPLKAADIEGLKNKLLEIGITEAADLEDLEPEEIDTLANYLLVLPRRQFRKYLGQ
jgi:hypothetical protein